MSAASAKLALAVLTGLTMALRLHSLKWLTLWDVAVVIQEPPVDGTVDVVRYAPGFERAKTEEDLEDLFRCVVESVLLQLH